MTYLGNGELAFCDVSGQLATIINCYEDKNDEESNDEDENLDLIDIIEKERGSQLCSISLIILSPKLISLFISRRRR